MNYLAYYEVIEGSGWVIDEDLGKLQSEWCFNMRIFEIPDGLTMDQLREEFGKMPMYNKVESKYKLIHKQGANLMHAYNERWSLNKS